jgi:hypothetical protein
MARQDDGDQVGPRFLHGEMRRDDDVFLAGMSAHRQQHAPVP